VRADEAERFRAHVLGAIDDLDRDLRVDVLVEPGARALARRAPGSRRVLRGSAYALVMPAADARGGGPARTVRRVMVSTGASDAIGIGAVIASDLAALLTDADIRLIVGPWGRGEPVGRVTTVHAPHGLDAEIASSDLVVTAGGVTLLEALQVGKPTVGVITAENQRRAVTAAAAAGAVLCSTSAEAARAASTLAEDYDARCALAAAARRHIDGNGPDRVAEELLACV
jgi:spore coat polysaccharide biosynthesis predicted glycosyltransferase SpsG